jgi:type IV secretion system protein VirD4
MRRAVLLAGLLLFGVGLWLATLYVASELHDAQGLGAPWWTWGEHRMYAPWAWLEWERFYAGRHAVVFRNASGITTFAALAGAALAASSALLRRKPMASRVHGSSRWATTGELGKAGLLREKAVVLCQTDDAKFETHIDRVGKVGMKALKLGRLVRHDGPEHVLCFAPTGSGKGVGLVVPTLLTWPHSVLVYDIKKENWALSAGWRRQFSRVWRFEPTAMDSVRFNPLLEVRRGLSEVKDVQNIADMLVDPTGEKETRDHWQLSAHNLLCGAILHVLYAEPDKTLSGVAAFLSDPSRTQVETLAGCSRWRTYRAVRIRLWPRWRARCSTGQTRSSRASIRRRWRAWACIGTRSSREIRRRVTFASRIS